MSNCSSDESKNLVGDDDRKCWWLEDEVCEASKQKDIHDKASRPTPKIVSFSCSVEQNI